jgi:hypothetical protein
MLYKLGRLLQLAGLIVLPCAISGNLSQTISVTGMYQLTFVGIGLFIAGYLLQQAGRGGGA